VRWSTNEIDAKALRALAENIDTGFENAEDKESILILNPLSWQRSGDVIVHVPGYKNRIHVADFSTNSEQCSDELGFETGVGSGDYRIHVRNVPPLGYKVLLFGPLMHGAGCPPYSNRNDLSNSFSTENATLKLTVDNTTGCITSLIDSNSKAEQSPPALAATSCSSSRTLPRITTHGTLTRHIRCAAERHREGGLGGTGRREVGTSGHPRHPPLAKTRNSSKPSASRAIGLTSTTRLTGTNRMCC